MQVQIQYHHLASPSENVVAFLETLEVSADELPSFDIDERILQQMLDEAKCSLPTQLFQPGKYLQKLVQFLLLDAKGIAATEPEAKSENRTPSCKKKRIWPAAIAVPLRSLKTLARAYAIRGFFQGFEAWLSKVWSLLLSSLVVNDLYFYYAYPNERYEMTWFTILFTHAQHERSLTAALTHVTIWPELILAPLLWGSIKSWRQCHQADPLTNHELQHLCDCLNNHHSGVWQDLVAWFLPIYQMRRTLESIHQKLLWDNRLDPEKRMRILHALTTFTSRTHKLTQIYCLRILNDLAFGVAPQDFIRLHQHRIDKKSLLSLLALKINAFRCLQDFAHRRELATNHSAQPLLSFTVANYYLWHKGHTIPKLMRPLFWLFNLIKFYLKAKFIYTIYQGVNQLINRYLAKRACDQQQRLWIYMDSVADYRCTDCGDLPIFYRNVFNPSACLTDFLRRPRNATQLVSLLRRLNLGEIITLDFSQQSIPDSELGIILQILRTKAPLLQTLWLNATKPIVGNLGITAISNFIKFSTLTTLSLRGQKINSDGVALLALGLVHSNILYLDLAYNFIGSQGAQNIARVLSRIKLLSLDLFGCAIQKEGAIAIAKTLAWSKLKFLNLGANAIGDAGTEALAYGLIGSNIDDLDLWDNNIGSHGAKILAVCIKHTLLRRLILRSNPAIGPYGTIAIAEALPHCALEHLDLCFVNMLDQGAVRLAFFLDQSKLLHLYLRSNEISSNGTIAIAQASTHALLRTLDLSYNKIGFAGVKALSNALRTNVLQQLVLESIALDDTSCTRLLFAIKESRVIELCLASNVIKNLNRNAVFAALQSPWLKTLDLGDNAIGNPGIRVIATGLHNSTLRSLSVYANSITTPGAIFFARALPGSKLQTLLFYDNPIGSRGAAEISNFLSQSNLKYLSLEACNIAADAVIQLAGKLPTCALENLELSFNTLGNSGSEALARILTTTNIKEPRLWIDTIGNDAKRALARATPNTFLKRLTVASAQINTTGAKALCRVLPQTEIDIWNFDLAENPINPNIVDIQSCAISVASKLRPPLVVSLTLQTLQWATQLMLGNTNPSLLPSPAAISVPTKVETTSSFSLLQYIIPLLTIMILMLLFYKLLRMLPRSDTHLSHFFTANSVAQPHNVDRNETVPKQSVSDRTNNWATFFFNHSCAVPVSAKSSLPTPVPH